MLRRRISLIPIWDEIVMPVMDMNESSFTEITGKNASSASYSNLTNIGSSTNTTYATLNYATGKGAVSRFNFVFDITSADIPLNAYIDNINLTIKYKFSGTAGNQGKSVLHISGINGEMTNMSAQTASDTTITYNNVTDTQRKRDNISTITIGFEFTAGNNGKEVNPAINFYGASLIITYHTRELD